MSNSSIRDPLDRLVTRREAHAISAHTSVEALNQAMETGLLQAMIRKALAEMQAQDDPNTPANIGPGYVVLPPSDGPAPGYLRDVQDLSEQAERVRGGG